MAVIKKTWNEMLIASNGLSSIINTDIIALGTALDTAFNTKYGTSTQVGQVLGYIKSSYLQPESPSNPNVWADLPIWLSSYKLKDSRFSYLVKDNLIRYLKFLTKMVTDEGIQRKMVVSRNFSNRNTSHNTDKNVYSETPQLVLQDFEDAIQYASNVSRNDNEGGSTQSGNSGETANNVNWDEALKNLQFAFYNEIVDYIIAIPSEAYNYYSLDSRPITELVVARRKALHDLFSL